MSNTQVSRQPLKFNASSRTPGITRPDTTKQPFNPADDIHADSGRVHADVRPPLSAGMNLPRLMPALSGGF